MCVFYIVYIYIFLWYFHRYHMLIFYVNCHSATGNTQRQGLQQLMKICRGAFLALTAARAMAMAQQGAMGNGHEGMCVYIYMIYVCSIYIYTYTIIYIHTITKTIDHIKKIRHEKRYHIVGYHIKQCWLYMEQYPIVSPVHPQSTP